MYLETKKDLADDCTDLEFAISIAAVSAFMNAMRREQRSLVDPLSDFTIYLHSDGKTTPKDIGEISVQVRQNPKGSTDGRVIDMLRIGFLREEGDKVAVFFFEGHSKTPSEVMDIITRKILTVTSV